MPQRARHVGYGLLLNPTLTVARVLERDSLRRHMEVSEKDTAMATI